MRTGDTIALFNGDGQFYYGLLNFEGKNDCSVNIERAELAGSESSLAITLMQGLASSEKMAWAIEKATELGATQIVPVQCHRSVAQLSPEKADKKQLHWLNIAQAASAQCGRAVVPKIAAAISSTDDKVFKTLADDHDALLVLAPSAQSSLSGWVQQNKQATPLKVMSRIAIYIGPEGGLDDGEIEFAMQVGFQTIRIGNRVLRTETAGATTIAALQALMGDF
jgi:16S rRNA (uracil1498-N3)-methyltransferase